MDGKIVDQFESTGYTKQEQEQMCCRACSANLNCEFWVIKSGEYKSQKMCSLMKGFVGLIGDDSRGNFKAPGG